MATIKDVAREAGVSVTLVSRYINGKKGVGKETTARIEEVVERLHYQPNQVARSLVQKETKLLGVLLDDFCDERNVPLIRGMEEAAQKEGYRLVLVSGGNDPDIKRQAYFDFALGRVDGMVVCGALGYDRTMRGGVPVATVDFEAPLLGGDTLLFDTQEATFQLARHLLQRRRWICLLADKTGGELSEARTAGYKRAMLQITDADHLHVVDCGHTHHDGYTTLRRLAGKNIFPEAVLAPSDAAAYGAIQAAIDLGKRVPEDILVAGFGGGGAAPSSTHPVLTTVIKPLREMGGEAIALVLRRIRNPELSPERKMYVPQLVLNASTRV